MRSTLAPEQLKDLEAAHKSGRLSDEEFAAAKARVVGTPVALQITLSSLAAPTNANMMRKPAAYAPLSEFAGSYADGNGCTTAKLTPHATHPHTLVASGTFCGACPYRGDEYIRHPSKSDRFFWASSSVPEFPAPPGLEGITKSQSYFWKSHLELAHIEMKADKTGFDWTSGSRVIKSMRRVGTEQVARV